MMMTTNDHPRRRVLGRSAATLLLAGAFAATVGATSADASLQIKPSVRPGQGPCSYAFLGCTSTSASIIHKGDNLFQLISLFPVGQSLPAAVWFTISCDDGYVDAKTAAVITSPSWPPAASVMLEDTHISGTTTTTCTATQQFVGNWATTTKVYGPYDPGGTLGLDHVAWLNHH